MTRLRLVCLLAALPVLAGFTWPGTVEWLCTRGIRQYRAGEFEAATESFSRALEAASADDQRAKLQYNRGTALHREGRHEESAQALAAACSATEPQLRADASYNLGNALMAADEVESAIEAYKDALRAVPGHEDAKFNLELAQRRRQQQQRDQQQQEQQQEQQQGASGDEQDRQQPQPGEDQREEDPGEQPEQQQEDRGESGEARQEEAPRAEDELTAEQARALLRALATQDAEMQEIIRRAPETGPAVEGEKDW